MYLFAFIIYRTSVLKLILFNSLLQKEALFGLNLFSYIFQVTFFMTKEEKVYSRNLIFTRPPPPQKKINKSIAYIYTIYIYIYISYTQRKIKKKTNVHFFYSDMIQLYIQALKHNKTEHEEKIHLSN